MIFSKKYKCCLFACFLLFACKSTDCGCPMAEKTPPQEKVSKVQKEFQVIIKSS